MILNRLIPFFIRKGRLLIANDASGDELWEIEPDGSDTQGINLREFPTNLLVPTSMTKFQGSLLVGDQSGADLWDIDPDGSDSQGTELRKMSVGSLFIAMADYNERLIALTTISYYYGLWEIDPDSGNNSQGTKLRDIFFNTPLTTGGMTTFNSRLLILTYSLDALWEVDPDGSSLQKLRNLPSTVNGDGRGLADYNGRLLFCTRNPNGADELWEIDPDGNDSEGTKLRNLPSGLVAPRAMTTF